MAFLRFPYISVFVCLHYEIRTNIIFIAHFLNSSDSALDGTPVSTELRERFAVVDGRRFFVIINVHFLNFF